MGVFNFDIYENPCELPGVLAARWVRIFRNFIHGVSINLKKYRASDHAHEYTEIKNIITEYNFHPQG